jgi:hypothetical protein
MSQNERPPVEGAEPPEKLAKIVNPIMKMLLRSPPLHRLVSRHLMLLTFKGRKTGRAYTVVVGRHEVDGKLIVPLGTTGRRWRLNFRGGTPVEVMMEGTLRRGWGELVEDPEEVARVHGLLLDRVSLKNVRRLGLRVNVHRRPTNEELKAVLTRRGVVLITLQEASR